MARGPITTMRGRKRRFGEVCLGGFGVALGLLMVYSLVVEDRRGEASAGAAGAIEVPVLFLERSEWRVFARGVRACVANGHGLGRLIAEEDDAMVVETARRRRRVRFAWTAVRGEGQMRDEVHRLLESSIPPPALVGSSNTLLTAAMAGQLREDAAGRPGGGPLLLVPWATSVSLLDFYPGRTFRFCSNNRRIAGLAVACLKARPDRPGPRRAVLVVDRLDPYSIDLARCFREAIAAAFPVAKIVEADAEGSTSPDRRLDDLAATTGQRHARAIWRDVVDGPGGETWVVLPLQNPPARRMIASINGAAPGRHDASARPLLVVCGDAIGPTSLAEFANQLVFPVWSVSTACDLSAADALGEDVQEQAEIAATLLAGLDRLGPVPTPDDLRATIGRGATADPAPIGPFGRPVAFTTEGEREGLDPGAVLSLAPGALHVMIHPSDRPNEPRPLRTEPRR